MKKYLVAIFLALCLVVALLPTETQAFDTRTMAPDSTGYYAPRSSLNPYSVDSNGANCTWYAHGRAYEVWGVRPNLAVQGEGGDAKYWLNIAQTRNYQTNSTTPVAGSIVVWNSPGTGHVAFVEKVYSNTSILITESSWGGSRFNKDVINPVTRWNGAGFSLLGYIYPPTALLTSIPDGIYCMKSAVGNSQCLDVEGFSCESGGNVQIWEGTGWANQNFLFERQADGYYTIMNVNSGKFLDVTNAATQSGTNVWQYVKNGTDAQKWGLVDAGNGCVFIVSKCNGLYLDVSGGLSANGTNVQVYTENRSNAQRWKLDTPLILIDDGSYSILSAVGNNQCLDVEGFSYESGGNVQIWEGTGWANQNFLFERQADGYYTIMNVNSGKFLDVTNAAAQPGTNVWQYTGNGTDAQKWGLVDAGNGYVFIVSKCNGLYLDVSGGQSADGTNVQVYTGNGTNAQRWRLAPK